MAVSRIATYPVNDFLEQAGITAAQFRSAVTAGLPVFRLGKRRFVRGEDWEQFLIQQAGGERPEKQDDSLEGGVCR